MAAGNPFDARGHGVQVQRMKLPLPAAAFLALIAFLSPAAQAEPLPLKIETPWVMAVPPVSSVTAAFMTLVNDDDQPLKIAAISSPIAGSVEPMITTTSEKEGQKMTGMETVESFVIPAHGKRTLQPGGDHLMLMDLKQHPKAGEKVLLTLQVEPGGQKIEVEAVVSMHEPKGSK